MKRNVATLADKEYDLAIVGGGIYGASVARDAALRGVSVVLVDKGDFGSATSANNHKIIHGGLRYLQHGDLKRMRESIRERSILMRIAPHLVHPLPFLIPTYGHLLQGKLVMGLVLRLNDLIGFDRNRGLERHNMIPRGRLISRAECLSLCPELDARGLSGGALFFDAQIYNVDRLNLSLLLSAAKDGADLANYVQVIGVSQQRNKITGLQARDVLSGDLVDIRARVVLNCSGPWIDRVRNLVKTEAEYSSVKWVKGVVLVTRSVVKHVALGIPSKTPYKDQDAIVKKGFRYLCITPWRNASLIGTYQVAYNDDVDDLCVNDGDIECFIDEVNTAFPRAAIRREDVRFVYAGLVPRADVRTNDVQVMKTYRIYDHEVEEGMRGLISVVPVKYTTARYVAEKTVNLVLRKLRRKPTECRTATRAVEGGTFHSMDDMTACALETKDKTVSEDSIQHLIKTYGSEYGRILRYCEQEASWGERVMDGSPVIRAEVIHGVREEMAQKLSDIIFRRTELGTTGYPGDACLGTCASIMAAELGWDEQRTVREVEETAGVYASLGCKP